MEITTDFDPGVVERLLDRLERDMDELRAAVPVQFAEWQSDDMNRKKPRTKTIETEKPTSAILSRRRPTSCRLALPGEASSPRHPQLRKRAPEMIKQSNQPVLRQELILDFRQRFTQLLHGAF